MTLDSSSSYVLCFSLLGSTHRRIRVWKSLNFYDICLSPHPSRNSSFCVRSQPLFTIKNHNHHVALKARWKVFMLLIALIKTLTERRKKDEQHFMCVRQTTGIKIFRLWGKFMKILINELLKYCRKFSFVKQRNKTSSGGEERRTIFARWVAMWYVSISCNEIFIVKWWKLLFVFYHTENHQINLWVSIANNSKVLSELVNWDLQIPATTSQLFRLTSEIFFLSNSLIMFINTSSSVECQQHFSPASIRRRLSQLTEES